jgi:hypothetical protein
VCARPSLGKEEGNVDACQQSRKLSRWDPAGETPAW